MVEENIVPDSIMFTKAIEIALNHVENGTYGVETFCLIVQNQIHRQAIDILAKNGQTLKFDENIDYDEFSVSVFKIIDGLDTRNKEKCIIAIKKIKELMEVYGINSLSETEKERIK